MATAVVGLLTKVAVSYAANYVTNKIFGSKNKSSSPTYSVGTLQTQTDSGMVMPVIYGKVKCAGNNLWQSGTGKTVQRVVGFGIGKNKSVSDVRLNDIPVGNVVLISIRNTMYSNATVKVGSVPGWDSGIYCYSSGDSFSLDTQASITISDIVDAINEHSEHGWVASTIAGSTGSDKIPKTSTVNCYNAPYEPKKILLPDCSYTAYMGDGEQEIDSRVPGDTQADKAKVVGGMKYDAYLAMTITASDSLNGSPNITAVWEGREVYVWDTPTVSHLEYTNNPAWCILDFMTSVDGCNIPIDEIDIQSYITAAAYFQPGDGSRHWELNLILDEKKTRQDWLNEMLLTCRSWRTYQNGTHGILVDKPEPVSQIFIVKKTESIQHDWQELKDDYERVIIKYPDPDYEWVTVGAAATIQPPFRNRKPLEQTIEIHGITNFKQASQQAWFALNQAQTCQDTITYTCNKRALNRTIGDVVGIYDPITQITEPGLNYKRYRILGMTEPQGMQIKMVLKEYNEALYTDALGSVEPVVNVTPLPNPAIAPAHVTNIEIKEHSRNQGNNVVLNDLYATFTPPDSQFYVHTEVYMKAHNPPVDEYDLTDPAFYDVPVENIGDVLENWKLMNTVKDDIVIQNLIIGETYSLKFVAVGKNNVKADFDTAPVITHTITGKMTIPSTPDNFVVQITDVVICTWTRIPDTDCDFYELRADQNPGVNAGMLARTASTKALPTLAERQGTLWLYAHNTAGVEGKYSVPASYSYYKAPPTVPQNVVITGVFQGFRLTTEALPTHCIGINVHIDGQAYFSNNNAYTFESRGGIFQVQVAFVDIFGEGELSPVQLVEVQSQLAIGELEDAAQKAIGKAQKSIDQETFDNAMDAVNDAMEIIDDAVTELGQTTVSKAEFTETKNELAQVDAENRTLISQTAESVSVVNGKLASAPDAPGQFESVAALNVKNNQIALVVNENKTATDNAIAAVDVKADGIKQTVASNKQDADGKINTLTGQINAVPGKITAAVTEAKQDIVNNEIAPVVNQVAQIELTTEGITNTVSGLQTQVDGKAANWVYAGVPTLSNQPAANWNTTALREKHLGDIYYDTSGKAAYVFSKTGTTYSWQGITADVDLSEIQSQINQQKDQISSIVTDTLENTQMTVMLQMLQGVYFKAADGSLHTVMAITPTEYYIKSSLTRIDGDTYIAGNVIASEMIKAKAVQAGHLESNTVSAMFANLGTFVSTGADGGKTTISGALTTVHHPNGQLAVRLGRW